jgi:transcriptional regulator with XRE-family HTH domain
MRISFSSKKNQREFFEKIMRYMNCFSLRELASRLDINYSSLKNYFCGRRTLREDLFLELCSLCSLNIKNFNFKLLEENWGKVKGGKVFRK